MKKEEMEITNLFRRASKHEKQNLVKRLLLIRNRERHVEPMVLWTPEQWESEVIELSKESLARSHKKKPKYRSRRERWYVAI
jgi:hypothetical protein